ncbi:hypothetical protein ABIB40_004230 [Pedobacter sp. UYP30]|uniref:DUF6630 family protein n=1 Tax=Pedobacter sp. UYP30 TaxID=1756400 RepID=UPI0033991708
MMENFIKLLDFLLPNGTDHNIIARKLQTTLSNPDKFLKENERMLNQSDDLLWFALIDGLLETGNAIELDWKDDISANDVEEMLKKQDHLINVDFRDNGYELEKALKDFGEQLENTPFILLQLDIESDSYVITTCKRDNFLILEKLDERFKGF